MIRLPKWVLTNPRPSVYDSESATAIEQTAKLYGAMQELIDDYNKFVEGVNNSMREFESNASKNYEEFTVGLRQEFQDFIDAVEIKIELLDNSLRGVSAEVAMQTVKKAIADGTIRLAEQYDEATESYSIVLTGGDE